MKKQAIVWRQRTYGEMLVTTKNSITTISFLRHIKKTVFLLPNHSYSIDEGSYESFKIEYLPLTSMGPKHSPDSIVIANLEHASWWWGNTKISQGALLNEREIALVRQWKLYDSSPVIF